VVVGEKVPDIVTLPPVNCTRGSDVWLVSVAPAPVRPDTARMRSVVEIVLFAALSTGPNSSAEAEKGAVKYG
jgi:hypothetical protein